MEKKDDFLPGYKKELVNRLLDVCGGISAVGHDHNWGEKKVVFEELGREDADDLRKD